MPQKKEITDSVTLDLTSHSRNWMKSRGWKPQGFQIETWQAFQQGKEGVINAPTGSGKTYSILLPAIFKAAQSKKKGLKIIWITPIRALAKEIQLSANRVIESSLLDLEVGIRTGDTSEKERAAQRKKSPDILITTPESLHLLLASKNASENFLNLQLLVADEWHELMGTKRGVMLELAIARIRSMVSTLQVWGISATIGNLNEAVEVLLFNRPAVLVVAHIQKNIEVVSLLPDAVEKMPWAGHLGIKMLDKVLPIVHNSRTSLIFTNTRNQCEVWYRHIIERDISLAGLMAMHHGSVSKELRYWVEDAIAEEKLKAVVCTSSLDLGVDFAPVETIIQIGGPKGVARFLQRAGRSGHRPEATSRIYFLPTHSLELLEAAALRSAIKENFIEEKEPMIRTFDVLIQFLITLACGEGFHPEKTFHQIKETFAFSTLSESEWKQILYFIQSGGDALYAYDDYHKVKRDGEMLVIANQRLARRHRMSIGVIVSDTMMAVKLQRGGLLGHVEESFLASLNEGDVFWFAGLSLELIRIKELTAYVKKSEKRNSKIPSWQGGRLPLSSKMSQMIRRKLTESMYQNPMQDIELDTIQPILKLQSERSHVPTENELLIEVFESKDGHHVVFYPFEGRFVHEGLASLFAYRIGKLFPISLSLAYNDYGFELLSDQRIPIEEALGAALTDAIDLESDMLSGVNATELAKRRFRDIAAIAGLVFKGYPGQTIKDRHLQSSSSLIFKVFADYESSNLLFKQAYEEVIHYQLEINRMRKALDRINAQSIIVKHPEKPTPFAFPIIVDRLRERMSTEAIEDRVEKMSLDFGEE